jgi:hypothetical protein
VILAAHTTRYYGTTRILSAGLDSNEVHPFADLFGDVFATTGLETFYMSLVHGNGLFVSARNFDPGFFAAWQVLETRDRTRDAVVVGIEQETTTLGGERNWISLMNPSPSPITVNVRAFTPGDAAAPSPNGTEHILPSIVVPAEARMDWSPDGIILKGRLGIRENQDDPADVPVAFFSLRFTSGSPFGLAGRREVRDPRGILLLVTPHVVENLDDY